MAHTFQSASPSIGCICLISRENQPLYVDIFPTASSIRQRTSADYHWAVLSALDAFRVRSSDPATGPPHNGDFGLLFALDQRLAVYGFLSATGVRYVVVVDLEGKIKMERESFEGGRMAQQWTSAGTGVNGIRHGDIWPVFRALQSAYVGLLRNPFFDPDEHGPQNVEVADALGRGKIGSQRFMALVRQVGEEWYPGLVHL